MAFRLDKEFCMETASPHTQVKYSDLLIRIIVAILAAHFIVTFGEDKTFFEFLLLGDYYKSVAGSAVIAFLLISVIRIITMRLDLKFGWNHVPIHRTVLQVLFGLVFASIIAFLLAAVYFRLYGINILTTVYLKYDFPVIVLFVLLINVYYFCYYLLSRLKSGAEVKEPDHLRNNYTTVFIVNKGTENLPVNIGSISSFYHDGSYNFLRLFEGTSYLIAQTLDDLEKQLDPDLFFRVSRQAILSRAACKSFRNLDYGKLEILTEPVTKEPVIVSQKRSAVFKKWLEQKPVSVVS